MSSDNIGLHSCELNEVLINKWVLISYPPKTFLSIHSASTHIQFHCFISLLGVAITTCQAPEEIYGDEEVMNFRSSDHDTWQRCWAGKKVAALQSAKFYWDRQTSLVHKRRGRGASHRRVGNGFPRRSI